MVPEVLLEVASLFIARPVPVFRSLSTLLGTLSTGVLDNGRGQARLHCLTHRHEVESGRTSSIGEQVRLGPPFPSPASSSVLTATAAS